jgi:hypothetical protein
MVKEVWGHPTTLVCFEVLRFATPTVTLLLIYRRAGKGRGTRGTGYETELDSNVIMNNYGTAKIVQLIARRASEGI